MNLKNLPFLLFAALAFAGGMADAQEAQASPSPSASPRSRHPTAVREDLGVVPNPTASPQPSVIRRTLREDLGAAPSATPREMRTSRPGEDLGPAPALTAEEKMEERLREMESGRPTPKPSVSPSPSRRRPRAAETPDQSEVPAE